MKFSVLLPTRNRLDYLKYAITSVLRQNYDNWEIIISDNASSENIEEYVHSLNEPRIIYSRSQEFLTVTQNWNRCLDLHTGDYVIMLGDDDFILKNYFAIASKLIQTFHQPDLIYTNAFLYAYPGVIPDFPKGIFQTFGSLNAMPKNDCPFWLDLSFRLKLVQDLLRFKPVYGTNMQHALIHKALIEKIKRRDIFFYSPYPDFYAMNALFMEAERVLIYPKELVVIGITPKSHGYYFFNKKEQEGIDMLNIQEEMNAIPNIQSHLIPVSGSMLTFWLGAMEMLKNHFPLEKHKLKLEYHLYRKYQIDHILRRYLHENVKHELKQLMKYFTIYEKTRIIYPRIIKHKILFPLLKKILPKFIKKIGFHILKIIKLPQNETPAFVAIFNSSLKNEFSNPLEIYEQVEPVDCISK